MNWTQSGEIRGVPLAAINQASTTVFLAEGGVQTRTVAPWIKTYEANPSDDRRRFKSFWLAPAAGTTLNNPTFVQSNGGATNMTACTSTNSVGCFGGPYPWHSTPPGEAPSSADFVNVGFADGHVKAMPLGKWYYPNSAYLDPKCGSGGSHQACP